MIVLASASPRRQELLKLIVSEFEIAPADIDETLPETITPEYAAEYLAVQKALAASLNRPEDAVIGCDTVVILENEILGKPADRVQAKFMLKKLSGKTHSVYTGVCFAADGLTISFTEKTAVTFYDLPESMIDSYIETGSPMDKAGAYGIQDDMVRIYTRGINGSFENVMGLPVAAIREKLMLNPTFKQHMI
jgi:septum formation protein